ncbi:MULTISPECIES: four helix bundle protein [Aequorivita]|jgi:four helix bundle protein|uniref:S23 ribosomal protein n=2 Tax=Aequorivita TaxID=153265 RepID=A0A137REP6_9FLAO|nr:MULTISPECIES: four helix bundle protein [Aequorivita]MAB58523.1 four helix bundle protein [Aequorivita sp.]KJJ37977.1 S23 ribosomal protein [Aequorivita vladivostokensis]KXN97966.1 S23 ribosomal protein [Aequorivita aquimaris]MAO48865.1 four helix bundle protein [Aequorivita sp.]MBF29568.1 four helix bundle protein [Aequorivita sp.]|tara:strand:- start:255385 stop:255762 length:378 start_codon:yes stop_codon:yes gene_type:complete
MDFKKLIAYQKSFDLGMAIYNVSKSFPKEETYSLTDQIRRSSRSVSANIAEAYRKRKYPRHYISKLTDSDGENSETSVWLDYAFACEYLNENLYKELTQENIEIGKLINFMINNPGKFGVDEEGL